ncbi:MAG TPA: hypothetical protein QF433_03205 [Candidatus Thalassarchaeaceae archaeon]|nr:hypothetical protein [Candidatus Thalassarchaeaceae archaeon]
MAEHARVCRCCRESLPEHYVNILCTVCSPWNDPNELIRLSMPAWQNYLQQHQQDLIDESRKWLQGEHRIVGAIPYNAGWAELLRQITGNMQISCSDVQLDEHRDYPAYLQIREIMAGRKSNLFPNLEGQDSGKGEIEVQFNGHQIRTSRLGLIVDGARVERGPGTLLFMMMLERRADSVVLRFLDLLHQIEGTVNSSRAEIETDRREALRGGHFSLVGAADAPQPESKRMNTIPAPLCDWSHDTYLLGTEFGARGRFVMPLPTQPSLLERFLRIWGGRPSMLVSDRLRALTRNLTKLIGIKAEDARITPLERSFSLFRSIVDANSDKIKKLDGALFIDGPSGVTWRVKPGRGAHNVPYLIQTTSKNRIAFGQPVCMYDDSNLPLGDRLASVVLGLLNDNILRTQFEQIHFAILMHEQRNPHLQRQFR